MQHDNSDDPWGFWEPETTRELKRTQVGTRLHGETRMVPVVRTEGTRPVDGSRRHINPLTARLAVMVGVMVLLVPIAISLRSDTRHVVRAAAIQAVDTIAVAKAPPPPAPTAATIPPETAAPTTVVATTVAPTPPPTEAVIVTPVATEAPTAPPTDPPTTATRPKQKTTPKPATTVAAPAVATQSIAQGQCGESYTVGKGDAWSSIAARAKVAMKDLLAANGATIKTVLLPGKQICLPQGAVAPGPPSTKPPAATQPPATQPPPATPQPTTPPATTLPATTQPPAPPNTYSKAAIAQIIRDIWPDALEDQAISIATRESNLIPTVRTYCCYGLFQIYFASHQAWLAGIGITSSAQLYDPRTNATAALALYNRSGGWGPWTVPSTTTTSVPV